MVKHKRKLRHVTIQRVLQSFVVRQSGAMAFLIYLTDAADRILSTPTFPLLCANSTCTAFTKVSRRVLRRGAVDGLLTDAQ
jgi:hypothetical protein